MMMLDKKMGRRRDLLLSGKGRRTNARMMRGVEKCHP